MWCEHVDWIHLAQDRFHGNETLRFVKGGEFLDWLSDCHLFKSDPAP
jgi:hypothetical protein